MIIILFSRGWGCRNVLRLFEQPWMIHCGGACQIGHDLDVCSTGSLLRSLPPHSQVTQQSTFGTTDPISNVASDIRYLLIQDIPSSRRAIHKKIQILYAAGRIL